MNLTDKINEDLKAAMKTGDQVRLMTVRSIRAALIELSKRGSGAITPEDETTALLTAAKKRKEAIEMYEKARREDLASTERAELSIIQTYLPKQLSRDDAEKVVIGVIELTSATTMKDLGKVMSAAMKELKGKIEGGVVQEIVKGKLGGRS